jgi:prevent-host-death family protein
MRSVNIRETRQTLSELVDAAEHGQSILITRHGKEVARLVPAAPATGGPLPDLSSFRASIRSKGVALSTVVTQSRRGARY